VAQAVPIHARPPVAKAVVAEIAAVARGSDVAASTQGEAVAQRSVSRCSWYFQHLEPLARCGLGCWCACFSAARAARPPAVHGLLSALVLTVLGPLGTGRVPLVRHKIPYGRVPWRLPSLGLWDICHRRGCPYVEFPLDRVSSPPQSPGLLLPVCNWVGMPT
jgi:hypothetical protein